MGADYTLERSVPPLGRASRSGGEKPWGLRGTVFFSGQGTFSLPSQAEADLGAKTVRGWLAEALLLSVGRSGRKKGPVDTGPSACRCW
jgi:hypothetical protein